MSSVRSRIFLSSSITTGNINSVFVSHRHRRRKLKRRKSPHWFLFRRRFPSRIFAWAENNVDKLLPKSPLATVMNYLLSNRDGLTCYLQDGHCDISNNTAENSIRPFTVGRKNWLFSNSPKGAKASAIVYSLIETKANDLDPERYLKYLFEKLPNIANFKDTETLD